MQNICIYQGTLRRFKGARKDFSWPKYLFYIKHLNCVNLHNVVLLTQKEHSLLKQTSSKYQITSESEDHASFYQFFVYQHIEMMGIEFIRAVATIWGQYLARPHILWIVINIINQSNIGPDLQVLLHPCLAKCLKLQLLPSPPLFYSSPTHGCQGYKCARFLPHFSRE